MSPDTCYNMGESWKHQAEWSQSQKTILHNYNHMKANSRQVYRDRKEISGCLGVWGGRWESIELKGTEFTFEVMRMF